MYPPSDAPPSSLMDLITNPKVKTTEGKGVDVHSMARSISGVEGRVGASGWKLGKITSN